MEPVVVVTLVAVGLAVLVIAVFLIAIARTLMRVGSQLHVVLSTVSRLPEKVAPAGGVLNEINTDLAETQGMLEGLLDKKLRR